MSTFKKLNHTADTQCILGRYLSTLYSFEVPNRKLVAPADCLMKPVWLHLFY